MRLLEEKKWHLTGGYHFHYTDRHKKERCSGIQISAVNENQEALSLIKINKINHQKESFVREFWQYWRTLFWPSHRPGKV